MSNVLMWKAYEAQGAIAAHRIVRTGAADGQVRTATAAAHLVVGVSGRAAAADGERVEIAHIGIADVKAGAAITRGNLLIATAGGEATPATASNDRIVGIALANAADGDLVPVLLQFSQR